MAIGSLDEHVVEQIRKVLALHNKVTKAVLFGSRAKGTAKPGSDIDIVLFGIEDALQAQSIADDLDELPTPYQFDVLAWNAIKTPSLREHIDRVGIQIF